jgi:hypothetical protein
MQVGAGTHFAGFKVIGEIACRSGQIHHKRYCGFFLNFFSCLVGESDQYS